jgi:hypothetical protein
MTFLHRCIPAIAFTSTVLIFFFTSLHACAYILHDVVNRDRIIHADAIPARTHASLDAHAFHDDSYRGHYLADSNAAYSDVELTAKRNDMQQESVRRFAPMYAKDLVASAGSLEWQATHNAMPWINPDVAEADLVDVTLEVEVTQEATTVLPAPTTLALMGIGLMGLTLHRRRTYWARR